MPADKRVDHLLLLAGSNPLPNAIAGSHLVQPNGRVTIVYTEGGAETREPASALHTWLTERLKPNVEIRLGKNPVTATSPSSIFLGTLAALDAFPTAGSIGLNYTGGTKAMAVHAHAAVAHWAAEHNIPIQMSYVDAMCRRFVFDPEGIDTGNNDTYQPIPADFSIDILSLLKLHGWNRDGQLRATPVAPAIAQRVEALYREGSGEDWSEWSKTALPSSWQSDTLGRHDRLTIEGCPLNELDGKSLAQVASAWNLESSQEVCDWLTSGWLRDVTLEALSLRAVTQRVRDFKALPGYGRFGVDALAIRGYQLYGFACVPLGDKTEFDKDSLRYRLTDVLVRTRQLGGDDACAALVCDVNDPYDLEREMRVAFGAAGRHIRVFNLRNPNSLKEQIACWIR